jgi:uncharacterized protein
MDVTPLVPANAPLIKSYGDGGFTIGAKRWEGSVLILPDRTLPWQVEQFDQLTLDSLVQVFDAQPLPEFLLIGVGREMRLLGNALRMDLRAKGLVSEPMDTGAACRTWNVLLHEGRQAAAALIAV